MHTGAGTVLDLKLDMFGNAPRSCKEVSWHDPMMVAMLTFEKVAMIRARGSY